MTNQAPATAHSLQIRRTFKASRERVYRAFTDPAEFAKWFRAGDDYKNTGTEINLEVGGSYCSTMQSPGAEIGHTAIGTYREIRPLEKIVFTLDWEADSKMGVDSVVTVEFFEQGENTEIILTHELLPDEERKNAHEGGWNKCLDQLVKALGK